jgi:phage anti-repressor protein
MDTLATHAQLFPVRIRLIGGEEKETVEGRHLHKFLKVKTPYTMWIQRALEAAQRIENRDFGVHKFVKNSKSSRKVHEYNLTLECCEHLGMMSDQEKGAQIRDFFINLKQIMIDKLQEEQAARANEPWFQRLIRATPAAFEAKFKGELAAHLNALNAKTRKGEPKLPTDMGSERVAGIVPNRIRQGYVGTLGDEAYAEVQRLAKANGLNAAHRLLEDMSLDMMRGLMYGLAVAARSEQHYEDMFEAATRNNQLCMALRWPQLTEMGFSPPQAAPFEW